LRPAGRDAVGRGLRRRCIARRHAAIEATHARRRSAPHRDPQSGRLGAADADRGRSRPADQPLAPLPMKHEHWFAARRPLYAATSFALAMLIGGCANLQDWADSIRDRAAGAPAAAGAPERSAAGGRGDARSMLADGIGRYEAGDYVGAIRTLNA